MQKPISTNSLTSDFRNIASPEEKRDRRALGAWHNESRGKNSEIPMPETPHHVIGENMRDVYRFIILAVLIGCLSYSAFHQFWNASGGYGFCLICYLIWLGLVSVRE